MRPADAATAAPDATIGIGNNQLSAVSCQLQDKIDF
jgi:hypothetical protein